jgi:hypothetical protein
MGRPKGDRDPSLGDMGETLRDGDELTGVNWSCRKNGRSNSLLILSLSLKIYNLLAALVSTLGGIIRPGFKFPGPFVGFCLYGILLKFPLDSGGGVASDFVSLHLQGIRK